jgi:hypothetical protein
MTGMTCRKMATTFRFVPPNLTRYRDLPLSSIRYALRNLNACVRRRLFFDAFGQDKTAAQARDPSGRFASRPPSCQLCQW